MVKGERDPTNGSKPHSNGEYFSFDTSPLATLPNRINKNEIKNGTITIM